MQFVPTTLNRHPAFSRLALAAALLFAVWQGISVQHLHAGELLQSDCAVCAAAQHDDVALDTTIGTGSPLVPSAESFDFLSLRPSAEPFSGYGARAPPAR